jgi:hypothetical protein
LPRVFFVLLSLETVPQSSRPWYIADASGGKPGRTQAVAEKMLLAGLEQSEAAEDSPGFHVMAGLDGATATGGRSQTGANANKP